MLGFGFVCLFVQGVHAATHPQKVEIKISGSDEGRAFGGLGANTSGGDGKFLKEYPEPYRSDILDYLFKPKFGAGFQYLKVEMGGGEFVAVGAEPSHAFTREENANPVPRGYEFWIMNEARKRDPGMTLDALPWSFPGWCESPFSQDGVDWFVSFLNCAKKAYDIDMDYLAAAWNEKGTNRDWIVDKLRPTLDRAGYEDVKLHTPDHNSKHWKIFEEFETDPKYRAAIDAVSYHIYGLPPATQKAKDSGMPLMMSESTGGGGHGEMLALMKFYIRDKITTCVTWTPIAACYYGHSVWHQVGCILAQEPWSGHYKLKDSVWINAHLSQFAERGWQFLDPGCKRLDPDQSDIDNWQSATIALKDPKTDDWSIVTATSGNTVEFTVNLGDGLSTDTIHVWRTGAGDVYRRKEDIEVKDGKFTLSMEPRCFYSLTTTRGQQKGRPPHRIPASKKFPSPYSEDFESYKANAGISPNYFLDQTGAFDVVKSDRGGKCLQQVAPVEGHKWTGPRKPHTIFGDYLWGSYEFSVDVKIVGSYIEVGGRLDSTEEQGYRLVLSKNGRWKLRHHFAAPLSSGRIAGFKGNTWHTVKIRFFQDTITAYVDGKEITRLKKQTQSTMGRCFVGGDYSLNMFDNVKVVELKDPEVLISPEYMTAVVSSSYGSGERADKMFDGNDNTHWVSKADMPYPANVDVDLGATYKIGKMGYDPPASWDYPVKKYRLYNSEDGQNYTLFFEGEFNVRDFQKKSLWFDPVIARYIRFEILEVANMKNGRAGVSELSFYGTLIRGNPDEKDQITAVELAGYRKLDSSKFKIDVPNAKTGHPASNIFDDSVTSYWITDGEASFPVNVVVDLGKVNEVSVLSYSATGGPGNVREYKLYGSIDGKTYTEVHSGKFGLDWKTRNVKIRETKARYIRFQILKTSSVAEATPTAAGEANIADLALYTEK